MTKLLTIAIPTYNRSKLLDNQLTWLARAVKGFENDIEIFVSDNCSTDNTQHVINKWKAQLSHITFNSCKNQENIGVMKNIMNCLSSAKTKYVWAIGDDDTIDDRAVWYAVNKFKQYDDVSLLFLNFSGRNPTTGEPSHPRTIVGNRWFDIENEDGDGDGKAIFEHCMTKSVGSVMFLTATAYRTELLDRAVRVWPDGIDNWMYLAYLSGYCAAHGKTIVSKEIFIECIVGVSYWQKKPRASLLMQYKHLPEVVQKMTETGYSKRFYIGMMTQTFKDANLRVLLGALRRWPIFTIRTLITFIASAGRAIVGSTPVWELKTAKGQPLPEQPPA